MLRFKIVFLLQLLHSLGDCWSQILGEKKKEGEKNKVLYRFHSDSATLIGFVSVSDIHQLRSLFGSSRSGLTMNTQWIYDTPVHSDVEEKLRHLLTEIGNEEILGIQVCAYKGGHVIIDTAAGVLGRYDPRPVQPDSLFPVFSVTKGITAGMVHWLVDMGKLKLEEPIANIWPEFGNNGKDLIRVRHVLNHTSGLQNAMADFLNSNPLFLCDWDKCLQHIAGLSPETEPGFQQRYHSLSFGWLCGGVIEYASGKKFQQVLEEAIVHPLNIEGELYIGIPPGVESRLATLIDTEESEKFRESISRPEPRSDVATGLAVIFNALDMRRAIIPAANGHMTARALARYYAALAAGGIVPPPHSDLSKPPLGSHTHVPNEGNSCSTIDDIKTRRMFSNPKVRDAFVGVGDYSSLVLPNGYFGLGFRRFRSDSGEFRSFGHSGMGGSTGFCNINHDFAIAITVNKISLGGTTRRIVQLVCSELNVPVPDEFSEPGSGRPDVMEIYGTG